MRRAPDRRRTVRCGPRAPGPARARGVWPMTNAARAFSARATHTRLPATRDVRAALDALMTDGWSRRIVDIETRPLPYASSFAIDELDVWLDDERRIDLVCKGTGDADLLPSARGIKPAFLRNPLR